MDKNKKSSNIKSPKVDNKKISVYHEDYGYDFVPHLNEWVNIDEQKEKAEELEDI